MTRFLLSAVTLTTLALSTTASFADSRAREAIVDANRATELRAIEQGRYTGELTRREYRELLAEQARIREMERNAEAKGYISKHDFREIRAAQKAADQHIYNETHDAEVSLWRKWLYKHRS